MIDVMTSVICCLAIRSGNRKAVRRTYIPIEMI